MTRKKKQHQGRAKLNFSVPEYLKHDPEATGENIRGAFSNSITNNHAEEFGVEYTNHEVKAMSKQTKKQFQEELKQNYNVELAEEDSIDKGNK